MTDHPIPNLNVLAVRASRKMISDGHISICAINECLKTLGTCSQHAQSYQILNTLHCVKFSDMDPQLRAALPKLLQDVFHGTFSEDDFKDKQEVPKSFFQRLKA